MFKYAAQFSLTLFLVAVIVVGSGCRASKYGIEAFNQGNYQLAHDYLYEALKQEPDMVDQVTPLYIESVIKLVDEHIKKGQFDSALAQLEEAREITRDDARLRQSRIKVLLAFAKVCLDEGNLELARKNALEVLRIEPANMEGRKLKGRISIKLADNDMRSGRYQQALTRYREYLQDFPDDLQIKEKAADVFVARAEQLAQRRQYKDSLAAYATALDYIGGYTRAIRGALLVADNAGGGLTNNYIFLVQQAPRDGRLRKAVVEQLQRRSLDRLDSGDVGTAMEMINAAFELDTWAETHLEIYEDAVERIVAFQIDRGETEQAARTLAAAAKVMDPLKQNFERRSGTILQNEKNFFIGLDDHMALINRIIAETRTSLRKGSKLSDSDRDRAEIILGALQSQRDTLTNVQRTRNRKLLNTSYFNLDRDTVEVLSGIITKAQYDEYLKMNDRYRR